MSMKLKGKPLPILGGFRFKSTFHLAVDDDTRQQIIAGGYHREPLCTVDIDGKAVDINLRRLMGAGVSVSSSSKRPLIIAYDAIYAALADLKGMLKRDRSYRQHAGRSVRARPPC